MQIQPARPDDLDAVFELLAARSRAAFGISEVAREHVAQSFGLEGTDRFVARNGAVIGYASLDGAQDVDVAASRPEVGEALLAAVERRAAERGFAHVSAIVAAEDAPFDALVRRRGFGSRGEVLRMWRSLADVPSQPSWPAGIRVRGFADGDARAVHALLDRAYAGWDESYAPRPHEDWLRWATDHDGFDPSLWFLAERDGELVGCALNWREHQGRGWVKDLVVRADERGRGLGTALLHHGLRIYAGRGAERVGLKVDSTNPTGAPRLYERAGFAVDRRYGIWVKGL